MILARPMRDIAASRCWYYRRAAPRCAGTSDNSDVGRRLPATVARRRRRDGARRRGTAPDCCSSKPSKASPTDVDARRQLAEVLWQWPGDRRSGRPYRSGREARAAACATVVRSGEMLLALGDVERAPGAGRAGLGARFDAAGRLGAAGTRVPPARRAGTGAGRLHQALRYNPHAADVLLEAAELQYQLGRPQRASPRCRTCWSPIPPGEEPRRALWLEGLAYSAVDRPQDAVERLVRRQHARARPSRSCCSSSRGPDAAGRSAAALAHRTPGGRRGTRRQPIAGRPAASRGARRETAQSCDEAFAARCSRHSRRHRPPAVAGRRRAAGGADPGSCKVELGSDASRRRRLIPASHSRQEPRDASSHASRCRDFVHRSPRPALDGRPQRP